MLRGCCYVAVMDFTAAEYAQRDADRLREILAGPPVTWVLLGDSITQAVVHTHGRRGFAEHFAERVRGELGRLGDAVVNTAVAGSTSEELLPEFHWRAGRFSPDVVLAMYGTNDAVEGRDGVPGYRYRIDQIVQRSRDIGAIPVLQTPPPVQPGDGRDPEILAAYAEAVRGVAADLGVLLVDHHRHWMRAGADGPPALWFDDPTHPGAAGHVELARVLLQTLGIDDPSSGAYSLELEGAAAG
jgi:lysophospholipase L1-like esterase